MSSSSRPFPPKTTPLRLLIDARMVTPHFHGIGRYVRNLIRGLHQRGHKVSILSHHKKTSEIIGTPFIEDVIHCHSPFANPVETLELTYLVRWNTFDLIHFPSFSLPLIMPKNSIVTIHDLIHLYPPSKISHQVYYHTLARKSLLAAARIISVSEWTKNDLNSKLKIPLEKIDVVRNGLEESWFENSLQLPRPLEAVYFLCLSNPKPHKNVETLIRACQTLWNQGKDFRLALSLGGKDIPPQWGLTDRQRSKILLLRNLGDEALRSYFMHAQALVSPSLQEGYNYPVAEALTSGCPVILSQTSAHMEFRGDKLHFYHPADDSRALTALLTEHLTQRRVAGSEHNVHTLDMMVTETEKTYHRALTQFAP